MSALALAGFALFWAACIHDLATHRAAPRFRVTRRW